jgi:hypothetical protein
MDLKNKIDCFWNGAEYSRHPLSVEELSHELRLLQDKFTMLCIIVEILLAHASEHSKDQVEALFHPSTDDD